MSKPIDWEKGQGLLPAVVQDAGTGRVLMLAYMSEDSLRITLESKRVTFWSRSRGRLWTKGETSGNFLELVRIEPDCDGDALLVVARPAGQTCHLGKVSCFGDDHQYTALEFLAVLEKVVRSRKEQLPEGSYTSSLFEKGSGEISKKMGEEAIEVIVSASQSPQRSVEESADLVYHLIVFLVSRGLGLDDVIRELTRRHAG